MYTNCMAPSNTWRFPCLVIIFGANHRISCQPEVVSGTQIETCPLVRGIGAWNLSDPGTAVLAAGSEGPTAAARTEKSRV